MTAELDDATADAIVSGAACGLHWETCAVLAGVSAAVFRSWMRQAEAGEQPYLRLRARLELADAAMIERCLGAIRRAADKGDREAAAWILSRRYGLRLPKLPKLPKRVTPPKAPKLPKGRRVRPKA